MTYGWMRRADAARRTARGAASRRTVCAAAAARRSQWLRPPAAPHKRMCYWPSRARAL